MTKDPFEERLDALFDVAPAFHDDAAFVVRVERRIARAVRWQADILSVSWIVALAAVLFAVVSSLDLPPIEALTAPLTAALGRAEDFGGGWLLSAVAIGLVFTLQAIEERWVRD